MNDLTQDELDFIIKQLHWKVRHFEKSLDRTEKRFLTTGDNQLSRQVDRFSQSLETLLVILDKLEGGTQ